MDHCREEAANNHAYPQYAELGFDRLHRWKAEVIYWQLKKLAVKERRKGISNPLWGERN